MIIINSIDQWITIFKGFRKEKKSIGLIPTMGALHEGHMSLMERSIRENELTAATIFVNPTQFNNPDDLTNYPVTWDEDVAKLESSGVDYLLSPTYKDLYRDAYKYKIIETEYSHDLCGTARPGHFDGVLTVVMKLLNITGATKTYFGEKDWQQYRLIKGIVSCPLIREESGLAMSSRNKRLTAEQKKMAPLFFKTISSGKNTETMKKELTDSGFVIDYLKIKDNRVFGAVFLGEVRLIDNVSI
jgi:pantoate--beta-alanine ligase